MEFCRLIFFFLLLFVLDQITAQNSDYKPYRGNEDKQFEQRGSSSDGFFDNYLNTYKGDPNEGKLKKNQEKKTEYLTEAEKILNQLDSLERANKIDREKIKKTESVVDIRQNGHTLFKTVKTEVVTPEEQKKESTKEQPITPQNLDYHYLYEYERRVYKK